jgi:2',3'-cyclic-nucleotide 2'-phosphodiesterase
LLSSIRVLIIGDVVGQSGCRAVFYYLKNIIKEKNADFVVINGENSNEGRGITKQEVDNFYKSGVNVITSGNHIWQKKEIFNYLESEKYLLRPENYPKSVPGKGHCIFNIKDTDVCVINLQGRKHMFDLRCPFLVAREVIKSVIKKTKVIIIDFHAESTAEKEALGLYLDGKASVIAGTHTHIQTADERILPGGTAYITDIGMTGPRNSIIGMSISTGIERCLTQLPLKMEVVDDNADINGILVEIDTATGKALSIERVCRKTE